MIDLLYGDCYEIFNEIPSKSINHLISDIPYGVTGMEWDIAPNFNKLWLQINRIVKDNGNVLLFSTQPFTTDVINSNRENFKSQIIWTKDFPSKFGRMRSDYLIQSAHEVISLFIIPPFDKTKIIFNKVGKSLNYFHCNLEKGETKHPTQKPIKLMELLVSIYSNEGDVIFDPFMGSGTTGVACKKLNRNFIGIEQNRDFFEMAKGRML
jgi:site-specific DNA-methyltransferase (adenine-specific)